MCRWHEVTENLIHSSRKLIDWAQNVLRLWRLSDMCKSRWQLPFDGSMTEEGNIQVKTHSLWLGATKSNVVGPTANYSVCAEQTKVPQITSKVLVSGRKLQMYGNPNYRASSCDGPGTKWLLKLPEMRSLELQLSSVATQFHHMHSNMRCITMYVRFR
jgi:hypothetical protein